MTDTSATEREQDTRWRAALLFDLTGARLERHGVVPVHGGVARPRCGKTAAPSCPLHALMGIQGQLVVHLGQVPAPDRRRQLMEWVAAYHVALTEMECQAWPWDKAGPARQQLLRMAKALRGMGEMANPRFPQIRAELVSMFASELDSYTCWRCAATSHHPEDVSNRYCGNCHLFETREETTLP
jgi:hypothetical protein